MQLRAIVVPHEFDSPRQKLFTRIVELFKTVCENNNKNAQRVEKYTQVDEKSCVTSLLLCDPGWYVQRT